MRPTLKLGSAGPDVEVWQRIVGVRQDGHFGSGTATATTEWQRKRGLFADGVVGAQTWHAAGELSAPTVYTAASPAARAALRDANAAWPARSRASDGIMGDARHQATKSGHNAGNAVDVTHDPEDGCDALSVARMALGDPRTLYVISNARIWNNDPPHLDDRDGPGRPYNGSNPHRHHCHIEIRPELREDSSPWPWAP